MFGSYQPKIESVALPFGCVAPTDAARLVYLHKARHESGKSIASASGHFYFLAVRKLMKPLLDLSTVQASKAAYEQAAPIYAELLAALPAIGSFDAVATIPTGDLTVLAPYEEAIHRRSISAQILSPYLQRSGSSTDNIPCEERLERTTFDPLPGMVPSAHVVLIDDVIDSGVSAAAAIRAFKRIWKDTDLRFTVVCPLWITHEA
jgi:hypothetical protein